MKKKLPELSSLTKIPEKIPKLTILGEFKKFALRGNVIDLAVGVIIGGAFQKIVTSVVSDLIMPLVGLVTGGVNFDNQFLILKVPEKVTDEQLATATTLKAAQDLNIATFNYGAFITAVINFLIMAFVIFMMVRLINRLTDLGKKPAVVEEAVPTTKSCPYCRSEIAIEATRCPHCTSVLDKD